MKRACLLSLVLIEDPGGRPLRLYEDSYALVVGGQQIPERLAKLAWCTG